MPQARKADLAERLEIVPPRRPEHGEALFDMLAKVFGGRRGYVASLAGLRRDFSRNRLYDWDASRIGILDGRIVTHWGVVGYTMRVGEARVRVAGISRVATHGGFRKRGLMARTARACLRDLARYGYDMTVLFGIPNFYHRFGYVRAWSETVWQVSAADLPRERSAIRLQRFNPAPRREDLEALYNRFCARVTGTAVRPTHDRSPFSKTEGYLWRDSRGRPAGYVALDLRDMEKVRVTEAIGPAEQVLRAVGQLARRWRLGQVHFESLPRQSELGRRLWWGNCRCEFQHARCAGAMIRTVNLRSCLAKMAGELSRRLRASHLAAWRGRLLIADSREKVVLGIGRGRVTVVADRSASNAITGGEQIAQLLIGTDAPSAVIQAGRIRTHGDAAELAEVLFPNRHPLLYEWDRWY